MCQSDNWKNVIIDILYINSETFSFSMKRCFLNHNKV